MAVLLKTASVRVSSIQIMQVRVQSKGRHVWKSRYDGDVSDPPSDRVPEQGPNWFLVATEACGGGTPDLSSVLEVWVFMGFFGVGFTSGGARGAHETGRRAL